MELPTEHLGKWKTRSGGPRTAIGKARSSRNAVRHGCRANVPFLPHEDPAEYDQIARNWFDQYLPKTPAEYDLVKHIVDAAWRVQRTEYVFARLEAELFEAALAGTASDELYKRAELHRRYLTSAQNVFHKALRLFEFFRRTTPPPAAPLSGPPAEQVVEVAVNKYGETETRLNPTNEDLVLDLIDRRNPLLYRWLAFKDGVIPPEYAWAGKAPKDPSLKPEPGGDLLGLQVVPVETWHELIKHETRSDCGHVGPTGIGNRLDLFAEPNLAAQCPCPVCQAWRGLRG